MNWLKQEEGVPLLNFVGGSWVPLLNFEGVPGSQGPDVAGPGILAPLLQHASYIKPW